MNNTVSFMSANFVARQLGYHMTQGWGEGDRATNDHFKPVSTFAERFEEVLRDVRDLGFNAIDLWTGHLNPQWATDTHITTAKQLLAKYRLSVPSLAGNFGSSREVFEASCKLARALGVPVLGGSTSLLEGDRVFLVETLKRYQVKLGVENHPEKHPDELLAKIGSDGEGTIGAAVDTGWFATQGFDAAKALELLGDHLLGVHFKDVREVGQHNTCGYGAGIVPLERCLDVLQRSGYKGAISVEHEPEDRDPSDACKESLKMLKGWMEQRA